MNVDVPREYNAAVDFVDRHLSEGRGEKVAFIDDAGAHLRRARRARGTRRQRAARARRRARAARGALPARHRRLPVRLPRRDQGRRRARAAQHAAHAGRLRVHAARQPRARPRRERRAVREARAGRRRVAVPRDVVVGGADGGTASRSTRCSTKRAPRSTPRRRRADDVAFWLYSSGSTGTPKGAMHLHAHLAADRRALRARRPRHPRGRRRLLGGEAVLRVRPRQRADVPAARRRDRGADGRAADAGGGRCGDARAPAPTIFCGVPTLFASLLADPALDRAAGSTRAARQHLGRRGAAAARRRALARALRHRHPRRHRLDGDAPHLPLEPPRRRALRHDRQAGARLRAEARRRRRRAGRRRRGRRAVGARPVERASRYWNQRERASRRSTARGRAPAIATCATPTATTRTAGRADDMLKVGGIWVSPFEVETRARRAPGGARGGGRRSRRTTTASSSRRRSSCSRTRRGDASDALADELKAFVKARLAPYKYPRWIEFVDELPKTATGKIQRFKLRGG